MLYTHTEECIALNTSVVVVIVITMMAMGGKECKSLATDVGTPTKVLKL